MEPAVIANCVEQFDEINRELGWQLSYRQLSRTPFSARFWISEGCGFGLAAERLQGPVEVNGSPPENCIAVIVPLARQTLLWINGQPLTERSVALLMPGSELLATTRGLDGAYSILYPLAQFEADMWACYPEWTLPKLGGIRIFEAEKTVLAVLRRMLGAWFDWQLPAEKGGPDADSALLAAMMRCLTGDLLPCRETSQSKSRVLLSARDYISDNLGEKIRLEQICRHANVEARTLERLFQRELGVSPTGYLRARRLDSARKRLRAGGKVGDHVSKIAVDCGFTHLGRFAGDYYSFFNEYPSETLKRNG